jgi:hypothetical protein
VNIDEMVVELAEKCGDMQLEGRLLAGSKTTEAFAS